MATSIITVSARTKMAQARAGVTTLPTVAGFAFGDAGVDSSGNPTDISASASALSHEILRKPFSSKAKVSNTAYRYTCVLAANELAGKNISELALYDSEGDLINIKHFKSKGKDADIEMTFQVDDEF